MSLEFTAPNKANLTGLILAGGQGQRFNRQDKGLISFKNTTLIEYVIERLRPNVNQLLISANRNLDFYQSLNADCITDAIENFSGPLAGIHAALKNLQTDWLISVACDTPYFPADYVERMLTTLNESNSLLAIAQSNSQLQNVFMLAHKNLFNSLDTFLNKGERKAQIWVEQHQPVIVDFSDIDNAFYNINTPEDLIELEKM